MAEAKKSAVRNMASNIFASGGNGGDAASAPSSGSSASSAGPSAGAPVRTSVTVHAPAGGKSSMGDIISSDAGSEQQRSSTRLHQAPGGKTSINVFGGGGDDEARKGRAGNAHTNPSRESSQEEPAPVRSSTKLHQAPGGKTSINVFSNDAGDDAPKGRAGNAYTNPSRESSQDEPAAVRSSTRLHQAPGGKTSINVFGGDSGDDAPKGRAGNAYTNPSRESASEEPHAARSSTRVLNPSGGKQSVNVFAHNDEAPEATRSVSRTNPSRESASDIPEQSAARSSTRVLNPSGGKTSINVFAQDTSAPEATRNVSHTNASRESSHDAAPAAKSSTRILNPSGGKTSVNVFAHNEEAPEATRSVSRTNASRESAAEVPEQTSQRSSTRVLNPSGGKQSINVFGGSSDAAEPSGPRSNPHTNPSRESANDPAPGPQKSSTRVLNPSGGKQSVNIFSSGDDAPAAARPVPPTNASIESADSAPAPKKPSTRVSNPAGGKQSINLFGGGGNE